jgi:FkbM family methyltransferase
MGLFERLRFRHRAYKARRDERDEIEVLLRLIPRGSTVIDIGAYKGSHLFWLRHAVGAQGEVHAFEPQPALAKYLLARADEFGWTNVHVHGLALSDHAGEDELRFSSALRAGDPGASLAPSGAGAQAALQVSTATLDQHFPAPIAPALIKCDVEGHELAVLRGGAALLGRARPALLLECEARHIGERGLNQVFTWLAERAYSGEFFGPEGLRPLAEFRLDLHQPQHGPRFWDHPAYCNNFLFRARP